VQDLASGAYFYIQIDGEEMAVTSLTLNSGGSATLSVVRGTNGTTAATHAANASVYLVSDQRGEVTSFNNPAVVDIGAYQSTASTPAVLNSNPVVGATVTIGISSGTLNGTLTATTNSSGQATFSNLSVPTAGTYDLTASTGAVATTSNSFSISSGISLAFQTEPSGASAGSTLSPVIVSTAPSTVVSLALSSGTLGGTTTATANSGGLAAWKHHGIAPGGTFPNSRFARLPRWRSSLACLS